MFWKHPAIRETDCMIRFSLERRMKNQQQAEVFVNTWQEPTPHFHASHLSVTFHDVFLHVLLHHWDDHPAVWSNLGPSHPKKLSCLVFFWIIIRHEWLASRWCPMPQHSFDPAPSQVRWQVAGSPGHPPASSELCWHPCGQRQPEFARKPYRCWWWSQTAMSRNSGSATETAVWHKQFFSSLCPVQTWTIPHFPVTFPWRTETLAWFDGYNWNNCCQAWLCREIPVPRVTLQMGWHRLFWCGFAQKVGYWRSSYGRGKIGTWWTWSTNNMNIMNHWLLGATHVEYSQLFLWKLYRMMGMGQHLFYKGIFLFEHVLSVFCKGSPLAHPIRLLLV